MILLSIISVCALSAKSQTANDIINKYLESIGGSAAWKKIKTTTTAGTYNYGGMAFSFVAYARQPNKYKYIVTGNGKSFEQAFDGLNGWRIDGFKDEKEKTILKGKAGLAMANEADVQVEPSFIDYKQKGYRVTLDGEGVVDNKKCFVVKLVKSSTDTETYFFDKTDYSLLKKQAVSKNNELDNSVIDAFYSDYSREGNIVVPHNIRYAIKTQDILIVKISGIKFDLPVDDKMFQP